MERSNKSKGLNISKPRRAKKLQLQTHKFVNTRLTGSFRSMVKGRGLEFEGYRAYIPGHDDAARIDWAASSRSDKLLVKEFKEENHINIMFLVNAGSSMVFSSHEKLKIEYAIELLSALAYNALAAGDRVGVIVYGEKMRSHILPAMGKRQYYRLMDVLSNVELYGGPSDLLQAIKYATQRVERNSVIFILSDFIYDHENAEGALRLASLKFDTIGIMLRDPRDMEMPQKDVGEVVVQDPMTGDTLLVDPYAIRELYGAVAREQTDDVRQAFTRSKASLIELNTREDFMPHLVEFFKSRMTSWK